MLTHDDPVNVLPTPTGEPVVLIVEGEEAGPTRGAGVKGRWGVTEGAGRVQDKCVDSLENAPTYQLKADYYSNRLI